eukprot:3729012-Amphidinium_carterae.1
MPGTPSAATRVRRASVVSTAAPSGGGEADDASRASQMETESQVVPIPEVEGSTQEQAGETEELDRGASERFVRRRLDPMIEEQVRRIEGPDMQLFQACAVVDWDMEFVDDVCLKDACAVYDEGQGRHNFVVTRKGSDELDPTTIPESDWP